MSQRAHGFIFLLLSILFQSAAAGLGKYASISMQQFSIGEIITNWAYLLSLVCLALQAVTWQLTLVREPLSYAYAGMSLVYVNMLLMSVFVFHEQVKVGHYAGALLIVAGVVLVGIGRE